MKKIVLISCMIAILAVFGCSKKNIFSWAHKSGSDKSTESLTADANKALQNKDWAKAIEYFLEALEKDPKNSLARYGLAKASYKNAGLDLAELLSNAIDKMEESESGFSVSSSITPYDVLKVQNDFEDLIPIDNLEALYAANIIVIENLRKIGDGQCDGRIPADDPDVNINLAFALTMQAALLVMDSNCNGVPGETTDVIKINSDYEVDDTSLNLVPDRVKYKANVGLAITYGIGSNEASKIGITSAGRGALDYLDVAINSGNLPKAGMLTDMRDTFNEFFYDADNQSGLRDLYNKI